jgi:flagellar biosynthesis/type III secretory pathway protein FliH
MMPMTKEEASRFKERWKLVNEATIEETRRTPMAVKLHQLALMYEAAQTLGWAEGLKEGEEVVRERWRRLKERVHA